MTKYVHFSFLSHPFEASIVAATFMEIIQKLHGILKISVSERGPIFTRYFWIELFSCLGTQFTHISSYHFQSDGQTKIVKKNHKDIYVSLHPINRHNRSNSCPL